MFEPSGPGLIKANVIENLGETKLHKSDKIIILLS